MSTITISEKCTPLLQEARKVFALRGDQIQYTDLVRAGMLLSALPEFVEIASPTTLDKFRIIKAALFQSVKSTNFTLQFLKENIAAQIENETRKARRAFDIAFALNVRPSAMFRSRDYPGCPTFRLLDAPRFLRGFGITPDIVDKVDSRWDWRRSSWLVIHENEISDSAALQTALEKFEFIRAAMNLPDNLFKAKYFFAVQQVRMNLYVPPRMIMVLNRQDNTKIPYIIPGHGDYRIETWDKGSDSVRRTFALFRGKVVPESGTWLLRKILIAYCQALDSPQWEDIFIGLWRIMEYLILHDRSDYQSLRTVRAKIAQATGGGDFESRVLEAIEMKRHHLVHKGQFEQEMGNDIVMSTKYFVEKTILFLEKRRRQIVDMDYLDLYLNSMSEKNERLDKRIRVMKTIKEERQEKTREPKDKNTSKAAESPPEAKGKGQG